MLWWQPYQLFPWPIWIEVFHLDQYLHGTFNPNLHHVSHCLLSKKVIQDARACVLSLCCTNEGFARTDFIPCLGYHNDLHVSLCCLVQTWICALLSVKGGTFANDSICASSAKLLLKFCGSQWSRMWPAKWRTRWNLIVLFLIPVGLGAMNLKWHISQPLHWHLQLDFKDFGDCILFQPGMPLEVMTQALSSLFCVPKSHLIPVLGAGIEILLLPWCMKCKKKHDKKTTWHCCCEARTRTKTIWKMALGHVTITLMT